MVVFWYFCKSCGVNFSWVFTGSNDAKGCPKCHSNKIVRIKNKDIERRLKYDKHTTRNS
jgi:hypothetical protein